MSGRLDVYGSDDYAGMVTPRFAFYFGYEKTRCAFHGDDSDCECEEKEWCFTASYRGKELERYTRTALDEAVSRRTTLYPDEPYGYLLAGIGEYLG